MRKILVSQLTAARTGVSPHVAERHRRAGWLLRFGHAALLRMHQSPLMTHLLTLQAVAHVLKLKPANSSDGEMSAALDFCLPWVAGIDTRRRRYFLLTRSGGSGANCVSSIVILLATWTRVRRRFVDGRRVLDLLHRPLRRPVAAQELHRIDPEFLGKPSR
jgi:hypothetical protein